MNRLKAYLEDPLLNEMYRQIRAAGPIRSISLDLTNRCNLRCTGCYYFSEKMDEKQRPPDEAAFDAFIAREKKRGTNFVTVVGGEPSLMPDRLCKLHQNFHINLSTNGLVRIPYEGMEDMPIGISVWGNHHTDRLLRGGGKTDVFARALENYRNDPRAFWYFTTMPGHADEIETVVERCVANGNAVLFNFYSDLENVGGALDHRRGFNEVRKAIERVIRRFPRHILITSYLCDVVTGGRLYGEKWGHDVCTSLSVNHPANKDRLKNGKPYNPHFLAYNADLKTTRRCCTGNERGCESCFDVWQHFSWVMLNFKKHLRNKKDFTNWLSTSYLFYLINRLVDYEAGLALLPQIHKRLLTETDEEEPSFTPAMPVNLLRI